MNHPALNPVTQYTLEQIVLDIMSIGIMPIGFYITPGKQLNGQFLMRAMKEEYHALAKKECRTDDETNRMIVMRDQHDRLMTVIRDDMERERQEEAQAYLNSLPPKQARKVIKRRRMEIR